MTWLRRDRERRITGSMTRGEAIFFIVLALIVGLIGLGGFGCAKRQAVLPDTVSAAAPEVTLAEILPEVIPVMPDMAKVYFDFDKADLEAPARQALRENITIIRKLRVAKLIIEGHCDERGTHEYNMALGQRRADAAADYYRSMGISAEIKTISYGKVRPASKKHQLNRRAVTILE